MAATKKAARKPAAQSAPGNGQRWSQHVTETSDAMDLKPDVFTSHDPKAIAKSIKTSAEHSHRRKAAPFQSAMSMLDFYINRAGHNPDATQRKTLEDAKHVLRMLFGRDEPAAAPATKAVKKVAKKAAKKAATKAVPRAAAKKAPTKTATVKRATAKAAGQSATT